MRVLILVFSLLWYVHLMGYSNPVIPVSWEPRFAVWKKGDMVAIQRHSSKKPIVQCFNWNHLCEHSVVCVCIIYFPSYNYWNA